MGTRARTREAVRVPSARAGGRTEARCQSVVLAPDGTILGGNADGNAERPTSRIWFQSQFAATTSKSQAVAAITVVAAALHRHPPLRAGSAAYVCCAAWRTHGGCCMLRAVLCGPLARELRRLLLLPAHLLLDLAEHDAPPLLDDLCKQVMRCCNGSCAVAMGRALLQRNVCGRVGPWQKVGPSTMDAPPRFDGLRNA